MTIDTGLKPEGGTQRSPIAGAGAPSGVDAGPKRYSVQRKMAAVACLLRGEPLRCVGREANVSVAKLTEWRDRALAGAASALKERERDDREDEIARLQSKVGEITMDNELLSAKIAAIEAKSPLARRRSTMSQTVSPSTSRCYGLARVSRAWSVCAPAFIAFSRERHRLRSPVVAPVRQALVRMLTWPIISAGKSKRPTCRRRLSQTMGATARCRGSLEPSPRAPGDRREPLACAPSRRAQPREDARRNHRHRQGQ